MFKSGKMRLAAVVLTVALAATIVAGVAFAQTSSTAGTGQGRAGLYQTFISTLAANLGIDQNTLTAALTKTEQQMIDNAVSQGYLTQSQAEQMKADLQNHPGFFPFFGGPGGHGPGKPGGRGDLNAVARVLGMSVTDLQTQLQDGKKIPDLVQQQGMTMQQFQEKMFALKKQAIQQDVSSGKITQQQADQILQKMQTRLENGTGSSAAGTES